MGLPLTILLSSHKIITEEVLKKLPKHLPHPLVVVVAFYSIKILSAIVILNILNNLPHNFHIKHRLLSIIRQARLEEWHNQQHITPKNQVYHYQWTRLPQRGHRKLTLLLCIYPKKGNHFKIRSYFSVI